MTEMQAKEYLASVGLLVEFRIGWSQATLAVEDLMGLEACDLPLGVTAAVEITLPGDPLWSKAWVYLSRSADDQLNARIVRTRATSSSPDPDHDDQYLELIQAAIRGHARAREFVHADEFWTETPSISYGLTLASRQLEDGLNEVLRFEDRMHRAIMLVLTGEYGDVL